MEECIIFAFSPRTANCHAGVRTNTLWHSCTPLRNVKCLPGLATRTKQNAGQLMSNQRAIHTSSEEPPPPQAMPLQHLARSPPGKTSKPFLRLLPIPFISQRGSNPKSSGPINRHRLRYRSRRRLQHTSINLLSIFRIDRSIDSTYSTHPQQKTHRMPPPSSLPPLQPRPSDHYFRGLIQRLHGGSANNPHRPPASSSSRWCWVPSPATLLHGAVDAALCGVFLTGAWGAASSFEGLAGDLACRDVGR